MSHLFMRFEENAHPKVIVMGVGMTYLNDTNFALIFL